MSTPQAILAYISDQTSKFVPNSLPLTFPIAPVAPVSQLISHLTTNHVHSSYFPYMRFGVLHATRVATVWASMTKSRSGRVGILQDLVGYLTVAWGGGTMVSLLLNQPPSWLILPSSWVIYTTIYLGLVYTGIASFLIDNCPSILFNIITAYIDGVTRGTTISAVPALLPNGGNWLTMTILSGIAVCGGGWLVGGFGLNQKDWTLGIPAVLNGGVLDTLDLWGGMISGIIYASLLRLYPEFNFISNTLRGVLPVEILAVGAQSDITAVTDKETARAIAVLVYGSLLCARVITKTILQERSVPVVKKVSTKKIEKVSTPTSEKKSLGDDIEVEVVKSPARERKATPRKSPKPKK